MRNLVLVLGGLAVAVAIVVGIVAVAVVGGGDDNGGTTTEGSPTAEATPGTGDTPSATSGEGRLRLLGRDPITLDPACASDVDSANYIVEIFSGLVSIDKDLQTVGDIAETWDISDDGTVYTFNLRRGVLFHKGDRQVTAADVKYSMERALDPRTLSVVGEVYLADIVGAREFVEGDADEVTGIEVIDNYTLEITIDAPKPYFLAKLTYPTAYVVDRNQVEGSTCFSGTNWQRKPNATGPFKLKEWDLGQKIVLEPNQRYHLGASSLEEVVYTLGGGSGITMYENNEVDVVGVGINDIERVRDPADPLHAEFRETPRMDVWYIGFNVESPPFDDVDVRQAFAHAIDKDKLIEVVLRDAVVKANGILPPNIPGFNPDLEGLDFDPEKAKELLAKSEYSDGLPEIEIASSGRGASVGPVSEAILAMWEENLGVKVSTAQTEAATFFQGLEDGEFQMFEVGWVADYADPENFLKIKLYGKSKDNDNNYRNEEVDRLIEQADVEADEATRYALYQQAEQIIVSDAPWIVLFHDKFNVLIKPYVKGYQLPPFVIPRLRYVSIEEQ